GWVRSLRPPGRPRLPRCPEGGSLHHVQARPADAGDRRGLGVRHGDARRAAGHLSGPRGVLHGLSPRRPSRPPVRAAQGVSRRACTKGRWLNAAGLLVGGGLLVAGLYLNSQVITWVPEENRSLPPRSYLEHAPQYFPPSSPPGAVADRAPSNSGTP